MTLVLSRQLQNFLSTILILGAFLSLQGCSKSIPSDVPPKPSAAEAVPFSHEPLEDIYRELIAYSSGELRKENLSQEHTTRLEEYIRSASWVQPKSMSKTEQAVFWINMHNALYLREWSASVSEDKNFVESRLKKKRYFIAGELISVSDIPNRLSRISSDAKFNLLLGDGVEREFPHEAVSVLNIYELLDEKENGAISV